MMHPHTELRLISEDMGFGVFATRLIPAGTVVYAKDALDIAFAPGDPLIHDPAYAQTVEKYTYIEPDGTRVLSWDHAKYVNHCCEPSTLTTGYGFEIALRDLHPGDELTDDYAIFNSAMPMPCLCGVPGCRGLVRSEDFDSMVESWDLRIAAALARFDVVAQPMLSLIPIGTLRRLRKYLRTGEGFRSVATQKLPARRRAVAMVTLNGNGHHVRPPLARV